MSSRRTLAAAAAALLMGLSAVAAVAPAAAAPPAVPGPPDSLGRLAIVPMDDRPFPAYTPAAVARAGGFDTAVPDTTMLGEFLTAGDAEGVADWWSGAAEDADGSVVAVPMLAYGGLVASRQCRSTIEEASERLDVFEEVRAANPEQPVYAFDVIMRLTIEPYGSYPGTYAGKIRDWAVLHDRVVTLGQEEYRAEYEALADEIPQELKDDYWCTRERNHQINREMVQRVADGVVDYLILGQDDTTAFGPQRAEQIALRDLVAELGVEEKVKIYPGADVVGALLSAKHVTERLDVETTVDVEWSRTPGDEWVAPYQDIPYAELVEEYATTVGGTVVDDPYADVLLMANTAGGGSLEPFADRIQAAVAEGRTVAVGDDAIAGEVDPELYRLLAPRIQIGQLASWSGWNVGISLAQSVVHSALLEASREGTLLPGSPAATPVVEATGRLLERAAVADRELLLQELAHTQMFRNEVRDDIKAFAERNGDDPMYMTDVFDEANQLAIDRTRPLVEDLYAEEFAGAPLRLGHDGRTELTGSVSGLSSWQMELAWFRYQEMELYPTLRIPRDVADRSALLSVSVLPYELGVRPETEVSVPVSVVVRNDVGAQVSAEVAVSAPQGWTVPGPVVVDLGPFEVAEVELDLVTAPLAAESAAEYSVGVTHTSAVTGERVLEASAAGVVSAAWRNVLLGASGAVATSSGHSGAYQPAFAIDGNRVSNGSRWLTGAAAAHWLQVDLSRPETIDTVELFQYATPYQLREYRLLGSVDGVWEVLVEVADNAESTTLHSFAPVTVDAVRLEVTGTVDSRVRLYEIEATCRTSSCHA
ncbi:DUF4127 family protein [Georgenia subflava]|uniref:DUF4127 family protein n=1 Tax=Georgenia subflava TaxID=1622177 RepID=A0A6N7EE14_9MICO|nr:DUF4127 family protein [Georgenia subflava]MPV35453.1 DUF4127 family protein [Georgenia subflava]